ncbi:hypothetical protein [Frigoribacterium salinisoli]
MLVALLAARSTLPRRVVLVQLAESGGSGLAASRSDLLLVAGLVVVGLAIAWVVAAAAVLLTPARHVWVPHAAHWKVPSRRPVLRARLLHHVSLGVAVVWWSLALQLVATVLAQRGGPLAAWWVPAAISAVTVLVLVGGGLLLLTRWTPPARSAADPVARRTPATRGVRDVGGDARVPPPARSRTTPVPPRPPAAERPARPARATGARDTSSWNPQGTTRGDAAAGRATARGARSTGTAGGPARGTGEQGAGRPARPYQPVPKRPGATGGTSRGTDGRTPRG